MRKIVASMFISLDGVIGDPQDWHFPYYNDEMGAAVSAAMEGVDTILFGRVTYDSFAGAWPAREAAGEADAEFARILGDARKIVVSHRPLEFGWRNSEQLRGDLVESVRALKEEDGGVIGMSGSPSVVVQLLAAGLLDELRLLVHPIVLRAGLRLFPDAATPIPLELLSAQTFKTGVLNLVYGPGTAREGGYAEAREALGRA